ncbi:MAG: chemotaxis protein CheD [Planctomycetes bacterium]|nr:chemotaxis protein CheD [Planctomycetota bacterium]
MAAVVASGVALTLFDAKRGRGGMGHYIRPLREAGYSTALFAAPAIIALVEMMYAAGSAPEDIEAHLYGGASNPRAKSFASGLADDNVRVGKEILGKLGIPIAGLDVGGVRARKVVFQTATGESVVARVDNVRSSDWYPDFRLAHEYTEGQPR